MGQRAFASAFFATQATVQLHAANGGQVIPFFREEQVVEQVLSRLLGGRLARAHHAIDLNQCLQRRAGWVDTQRVRHERTTIQIVGVQSFDFCDASVENFGDDFFGQLGITLNQNLSGLGVHHVFREYTAVKVFRRHFQLGQARFFKLLDMTSGDPAPLFNDDRALFVLDVERGNVTAQAAWNQLELAHFRTDTELTGIKEHLQHLL